MLRVAYIAPIEFVQANVLTEDQEVEQLALETVAIAKHTDREQAKQLFSEERTELVAMKNKLSNLKKHAGLL